MGRMTEGDGSQRDHPAEQLHDGSVRLILCLHVEGLKGSQILVQKDRANTRAHFEKTVGVYVVIGDADQPGAIGGYFVAPNPNNLQAVNSPSSVFR